jgi:hypothetical protein
MVFHFSTEINKKRKVDRKLFVAIEEVGVKYNFVDAIN